MLTLDSTPALHRHGCCADDLLRIAAHEDVSDATPSVGADDDQVRVPDLGQLDDHVVGAVLGGGDDDKVSSCVGFRALTPVNVGKTEQGSIPSCLLARLIGIEA